MKTRFAPSPTGFLHLGHVLSAIYVWGVAAQNGLSVVLRIEDHDQQRFRKEFEEAILQDLKWLGFFNHIESLIYQRDRLKRYEEVAKDLFSKDQAYYCRCSRKDLMKRLPVERQSSTNEDTPYDGHCRHLKLKPDRNTSLRLRVPNDLVTFKDEFLGLKTQKPSDQCGDFVLQERSQSWSYQHCVVIDDFDQKINFIIRGEDILSSTGRQIQMRQMIDPNFQIDTLKFLHHPLIREPSGEKLSKRFFSKSISEFRSQGHHPEEILTMAAVAGNLWDSKELLTFNDLKDLNFLP